MSRKETSKICASSSTGGYFFHTFISLIGKSIQLYLLISSVVLCLSLAFVSLCSYQSCSLTPFKGVNTEKPYFTQSFLMQHTKVQHSTLLCSFAKSIDYPEIYSKTFNLILVLQCMKMFKICSMCVHMIKLLWQHT